MPKDALIRKPLEPRYRSIDETNLSNEQFEKILCPNMRIGIRMSLMEPDSEGWVTEHELRGYLEYIGLIAKSKVEKLLISTGESAPKMKKPGHINLSAFEDTFLDHGSSSGILNSPSGFSQQRLDFLLTYADNEGRIDKSELALALNNFYRCPVKCKSFSGTHVLSFEFVGLLEIFGRTDVKTGEKYFTQDDVISLWKHNRFPEGWSAPSKTFYGSWAAYWNYVKMMCARIKVGWWRVKPE